MVRNNKIKQKAYLRLSHECARYNARPPHGFHASLAAISEYSIYVYVGVNENSLNRPMFSWLRERGSSATGIPLESNDAALRGWMFVFGQHELGVATAFKLAFG